MFNSFQVNKLSNCWWSVCGSNIVSHCNGYNSWLFDFFGEMSKWMNECENEAIQLLCGIQRWIRYFLESAIRHLAFCILHKYYYHTHDHQMIALIYFIVWFWQHCDVTIDHRIFEFIYYLHTFFRLFGAFPVGDLKPHKFNFLHIWYYIIIIIIISTAT